MRLDQPGKNWKDFQLLPRFEKMRGKSLSFAGGAVEDQGRGGGGGEDSVEAAGCQGLVQTIVEELSLCLLVGGGGKVFDSMSEIDFTVSPIPFLLLSRNCPTGTSSMQISWNGSEQQTGEKKAFPVSTSVHLDLMFTQNYLSRDARKTEDKTFVAAPFQPVEPGTEWERSVQLLSFFLFFSRF